ncbi:MOSC domain-containing protein [Desulfobulbus alkaliphilus]|uniref:MOSC domain-containing protein n=1 Tax=Desulfobulbus alkaliphilus TaxID=869814 RepID=UPI0019646A2F|nr:MOSC domain-containing protein [Desulfobulbus alkaliphilus]MBM9537014.1 MOSC domain-containing protein [Desulfobulbus alkaliphilus]
MGKIISLNISREKGVHKEPVERAELKIDHGMVGDAHAGDWHRQVSLLAEESIALMRAQGLELDPGSFAENITTEGLALSSLPIGTRLGNGEIVLEVTQIGKKCHHGCAIFKQVGDCIMPREGIFAKVVTPGILHRGDSLDILT